MSASVEVYQHGVLVRTEAAPDRSAEAAAVATAAAKAALVSAEPVPRAARAGTFALMFSLQEARSKINELVAWANANGASIAALETGTTPTEAIRQVAALLDSGGV